MFFFTESQITALRESKNEVPVTLKAYESDMEYIKESSASFEKKRAITESKKILNRFLKDNDIDCEARGRVENKDFKEGSTLNIAFIFKQKMAKTFLIGIFKTSTAAVAYKQEVKEKEYPKLKSLFNNNSKVNELNRILASNKDTQKIKFKSIKKEDDGYIVILGE